MTKHVGAEAAKERRRAVDSRKRGELWIVGEDMNGKEARRRVVERRRAVESCGNKESRRTVARRRGRKM